ncbi:MAG: RluA family pseudouridine synthase [Clostridia bacterium]|nr:RluA family pseudouridine synthase [Clostridia bacterium]
MSEKLTIIIPEDNDGDRLDTAISENMQDVSRARCQKLIKEGAVLLNGKAEKASKTVREGDVATVEIPELKPVELLPQDIPLDIVWQDENMAVINKQQGLTVHPANGVYTDTLVNALLFHVKDLSGINGDIRPGIVHRLDKDTSGLMVVAKNDVAHRSLAEQISTKTCRRIYYALVEGVVKTDHGFVEKPIGRSKSDRKKMGIVPDGKYAKTFYTVIERFEKNTLMKFELTTGRTHQIRVHTQYLGHPVVGDKTYGFKNQRFDLAGQLLHSKEILFVHPITGEQMHFECDLPDYFANVLSKLKKV